MALADIIKRIAQDAQAEAADLFAEAQAEAERMRTEAVAGAAREREAHLALVKMLAEEEARTRVASARLRGRDRVLAEKRVLIGRVLDRAVAHIEASDDAAYVSLLAREVALMARGGESVRPAAAEAARFSGSLVSALAEAGADVTVAPPTDDITRGVMLEGDRMRVEVSVRAMAATRRAQLEELISDRLFGGEKEQ